MQGKHVLGEIDTHAQNGHDLHRSQFGTGKSFSFVRLLGIMNLTTMEAESIATRVRPLLEEVLALYDFGKYPAEQYEKFKRAFSENGPTPPIEDALRWKWGHWGKENYPDAHKRLISEVSRNWPDFAASEASSASRNTFEWWSNRLGRRTTYITAAFLTHLVHHSKSLPIIDQHNFRAMNALVAEVRPRHQGKKKPSSWADIHDLREFLLSVLPNLEGRTLGEFDRFLMMYGRHRALR